MKEINFNRNIFLYRLYILFNEPLFWGPILIISLQKLAGMTLPDIYYMESVVMCICLILDIPSGALADVIGRKKTIIIGRIFLFLSICFFATMTDKSGAWAGNILWVIGFTMQSGADTSFLYDTLKEGGREHEYKSIDGKSVGLRFLLVAFCSLITGALASIDPRLPLYLCIPFVLIPLVSSLFIHEPIHTSEYSVRKQLNVLKQGIVFIFKSKEVRFMVGLTTLLMCISKLWFFTYNPYFEIVGMEVSNFGFIFFLLNLVAWFSSHYAERIEAVLGEGRCILVMVMCIGVPILLMGLFPLQICAYLVLSQSLVRGFLRPFTGDYMHRHIKTEIRATAMSVKTSVASIASIASLFLFGLLIEKIGLLHSLVILGVTCLTLGIYAYDVFKNKIK